MLAHLYKKAVVTRLVHAFYLGSQPIVLETSSADSIVGMNSRSAADLTL